MFLTMMFFFDRFSFPRNGVSPNSNVKNTKTCVMKDVWLQMVATLNTDQNTVQWLHGKKFKHKSILNKSLINNYGYMLDIESNRFSEK